MKHLVILRKEKLMTKEEKRESRGRSEESIQEACILIWISTI
jgi:hypothetical protein